MGVSLINYIQKRLNSLLFRILCITYAIVIISISIDILCCHYNIFYFVHNIKQTFKM